MILDEIKTALRISHSSLDGEIKDLIAAGRLDLIQSGISPTLAEAEGTEAAPIDPLIKRALTVYCKANFVSDRNEAERFQMAYDMLKIHLGLSNDYKVIEGDVIA